MGENIRFLLYLYPDKFIYFQTYFAKLVIFLSLSLQYSNIICGTRFCIQNENILSASMTPVEFNQKSQADPRWRCGPGSQHGTQQKSSGETDLTFHDLWPLIHQLSKDQWEKPPIYFIYSYHYRIEEQYIIARKVRYKANHLDKTA